MSVSGVEVAMVVGGWERSWRWIDDVCMYDWDVITRVLKYDITEMEVSDRPRKEI